MTAPAGSGEAPPGPRAWARGGRCVEVEGLEIYVRRGGEGGGAPAVLLHGFPTCSWDWRAVWPGISAEREVLALDFPGFGLSSKPPEADYAIAAQADRVEAVLASEAIDRVHLLAHDYGDTVAQELLARDLERAGAGDGGAPRFLSACFLNGGLFPEANRPLAIQKVLLSPLGRWIGPRVPYVLFRRALGRTFGPGWTPTEREMRAWWRLILRREGRRAVHPVIQYLRERERHRGRWVGALQRTDVPLALVDGPADRISGRRMLERWRELLPDARGVALDPEVGHYPQLEAPGAVMELWRPFARGAETACDRRDGGKR